MLEFLKSQDMFNRHENKDAIKNIIAVLMIQVVNADDKVSTKEQDKVLNFFKLEFKMNEEETIKYFNNLKNNKEELDELVLRLDDILKNDTLAKSKILHHLNSIIICDGCLDVEFEVFEKIKKYLC
jgi:uncharacterized tellurite resistance protein B-like protein